jgi:hypothetical protein
MKEDTSQWSSLAAPTMRDDSMIPWSPTSHSSCCNLDFVVAAHRGLHQHAIHLREQDHSCTRSFKADFR